MATNELINIKAHHMKTHTAVPKAQKISTAETQYCCTSKGRFTPPEPVKMRVGAVNPASIARACCRPSRRANKIGSRACTPKKGGDLISFLSGLGGIKRYL